MFNIMLVEDDPTMLDLLTTLLQLEGFEVTTLERNEEISASVKRNQPDLIIMDVHLRVWGGKEISGFDLLKQIRSDEEIKEIKVIISSGIDFRIECKEKKADGFLLKPYMPDELIDMIKDLIE